MKTIYIYSGKGGVGKTTSAINLAYAFKLNGFSTSIFDADVYGPNINDMVKKIEEQKPRIKNFSIVPGIYGGVKINSIGFIANKLEASYWTSKYLEGALYQLAYSVNWNTDILIIDLPPGSGEIHQNLFSNMPGKVVLVTTPQEVSYSDTIRGIEMLEKLQIDILGIIENMSYYQCNECKQKERIFSGNTKEKISKPFDLPILTQIPIDKELYATCNEGTPYVISKKNSYISKQFNDLTKKILKNYSKPKHRRPVG